MDYNEALSRLANHANQPRNEEIPPKESLIFNLWQTTRGGKLPDLELLGSDIINCLEVVNKFINSSQPSGTFEKKEVIDRELINAVSSIITGGHEYILRWQKRTFFTPADLSNLSQIIWQISHAWCAIIHGDIDSLSDDIALQRQTKEI